jgi:hypothetical protein
MIGTNTRRPVNSTRALAPVSMPVLFRQTAPKPSGVASHAGGDTYNTLQARADGGAASMDLAAGFRTCSQPLKHTTCFERVRSLSLWLVVILRQGHFVAVAVAVAVAVSSPSRRPYLPDNTSVMDTLHHTHPKSPRITIYDAIMPCSLILVARLLSPGKHSMEQ